DARRGQDAQHRENAVPGDQKWSDAEEVRLQVDRDREEHQSITRASRFRATSLGSSASVWSMGGETFLPVTARRRGMNVLLGPSPEASTTFIRAAWIGSGSHSTS